MKDFRVLAIFVILYVGLSIAPLLYHSVTIDEFAHIPVGYAQLYYGQYQLESANPPLVRMIFTIPLGIFHPILYWGPHLDEINYFPYSQYFQETNAGIYQTLAIICRSVVLLLALILGILVFYWAKAEYGYYPAIGVLLLYLLNPNILAFGALATTDLGLAFFWVLCLFGFKKYLDKPGWKTVILMGLLLGLAQAAKFTSLLLYPILIMISIWDGDTRKRMKTIKYWGELISICLLSLFVIMVCYRFDRIFFPMDSFQATYPLFQWLKQILPDDLLVPFPYHYVKGLDIQLGSAARFSNYLNGSYHDHGVWYYYLEAFLIKNPIPFLIILLGGMVIIIQKIKELSRNEIIWITGAMVIFLAFSLNGTKNLGLRYLLPMFPLLFLLCGRLFQYLIEKKSYLLTGALGLWMVGAVVWISPHYLSYFNEFTGGPSKGYFYLIDSNIDWGQDLIRLHDYLNHQGIDKIYLSHCGPVDPRIYNIDFQRLPPHPVSGTVVISVNQYMGLMGSTPEEREMFSWLRAYEPVKRIGYSIWVYQIP